MKTSSEPSQSTAAGTGPVAEIVDDHDAGELRRTARGLRPRRSAALGFDQDRLAVAVRHRHAHGCRADLDRLVAEDLAGLVDHLHLFAGVARLLLAADLRDAVEGDGVLESLCTCSRLPSRWALAAFDEILLSLHAGPAGGLIGADDHALDLRRVVQRLERHGHLRGRAVRAGDDPLRVEGVLRIDLRDDERDILVHAPVAGFVDDVAPACDRRGEIFGGDFIGRRGDHEVTPGKGAAWSVLRRDRFVRETGSTSPRCGPMPEIETFRPESPAVRGDPA